MPEGADSDYIQNITDMRESFARLDEALEQVQGLTASGSGLDAISVKALFLSSVLADRICRPQRRRRRPLWTASSAMRRRPKSNGMRTAAPSLWKLSQRSPCRSPALTPALEEAGYLIDEETEAAIREVYLRYAYHGRQLFR